MRDRATIHVSKINELKKFLIGRDFKIIATKGDYEAIRAKCDSQLVIFHRRPRSNHLTSHGLGSMLAHNFICRRRKEKEI